MNELSLRFYDKYGKPLELFEWAELSEDNNYRRIGFTKLWWGGRVSTVWLGLDHNYFDDEKPLSFETMVFGWRSSHYLYCERYSGLADARNGHIEAIKNWSSPLYLIIFLYTALRRR